MNYYIDIKLNPDDEIPLFFIRNSLCNKLHKELFRLYANDIGVSFPHYKEKANPEKTERLLGDTARLHATEARLTELQSTNWLGGLSGYCDISAIEAIPDNVNYRIISRKQSTMSLSKLDKRVAHQIKNGQLKTKSEIQAYQKQYKDKMYSQMTDYSYLELRSSKGQTYRRYLMFGELIDNPIGGEFDHFGLSKTATIPWF